MTMTMETKTMAATCRCLRRCRSLADCCLCPCHCCCRQCLQRHCGGTMSASVTNVCLHCAVDALPPPSPRPLQLRYQHAAAVATATALSLPPCYQRRCSRRAMDAITTAVLWTPPLPPHYCRCRCRRTIAAALPSRPPQPTGYCRRCRRAIVAAAATTALPVTVLTLLLRRCRRRPTIFIAVKLQLPVPSCRALTMP